MKEIKIIELDRESRQNCLEDILQIAYGQYKQEFCSKGIAYNEMSNFKEQVIGKLKKLDGYLALYEGKCVGYMFIKKREANITNAISIPIYGYGGITERRVEIISRLFCYIAAKCVGIKTTVFCVHLYAYDMEVQRLFSYMQFGTEASEGIHLIKTEKVISDYDIVKLTKEELHTNWDKVWNMVKQIVEHLKSSPVF